MWMCCIGRQERCQVGWVKCAQQFRESFRWKIHGIPGMGKNKSCQLFKEILDRECWWNFCYLMKKKVANFCDVWLELLPAYARLILKKKTGVCSCFPQMNATLTQQQSYVACVFFSVSLNRKVGSSLVKSNLFVFLLRKQLY